MKDRQRKGFSPKFAQPKIDQKIELAENNQKELQDILDYLNSEECMRTSEDTQNRDQQLRNLNTLLEQKGKQLATVSPDIIEHIARFEAMNNLDKRYDICEVSPEEVLHLPRHRKPKYTRKKAKVQEKTIANQFGSEPTGQADLIVRQNAKDGRTTLEAKIKSNLVS